MANRIFDELLIQQFNSFQRAFVDSEKVFFDENTKRLKHPAEFGTYRETICKNFLRLLIPSRLDISQGFLINTNDQVSTQCDIVVYDSRVTPLIQANELQRFFPVETVCAVGEVKSSLDKRDLREALNKLARIKKLAEFIRDPSIIYKTLPGSYDPENCPYDQIVTFLICQRLNFHLHNFDELYDTDIEYRHRHNMILSLQDGVMLYSLGDNQSDEGMHVYPVMQGRKLSSAIMKPETAGNDYLKIFAHYMFLATSNVTTLFPDICNYMVYPDIERSNRENR